MIMTIIMMMITKALIMCHISAGLIGTLQYKTQILPNESKVPLENPHAEL